MQKNQILTVTIEDMNILGFGIAKVDKAVIFVQNGVMGDVAKIRIIKCAKNYFVARIEELLEASPNREDPRCLHFRQCGGCSFQHVRYAAEKELKRNHIISCMKKAGVLNFEVKEVIGTEKVSRYRNKAQFPVSCDHEGNVVAGFFSPKTHKVCPVKDCLIQDEHFAPIVQFVLHFMEENRIQPYDEKTGKGLVRHIYLRRGRKTDETMLCLVLTKDDFPEEEKFTKGVTSAFPHIKSLVFNMNSKNTNVILGDQIRLVWGKEMIDEVLLGKTFGLSAHSFFQVNSECTDLLYQTAFSLADLSSHDLIVDLYCGIGSISLTAPTEKPVLGVEIIPQAVKNAKENALRNQRENTEFFCGDAADCFAYLGKKTFQNPLLIVDPPRKGLSPALIEDITASAISKILYISCSPDTLARDLALFQKGGYQISPIQPVDMFPRTGHVESVVCLTKEKS